MKTVNACELSWHGYSWNISKFYLSITETPISSEFHKIITWGTPYQVVLPLPDFLHRFAIHWICNSIFFVMHWATFFLCNIPNTLWNIRFCYNLVSSKLVCCFQEFVSHKFIVMYLLFHFYLTGLLYIHLFNLSSVSHRMLVT